MKEKAKIESSILKSQQRSFLCITSVMAASSSIISSQYSLAKLFYKKISQKLYIMNDMVQEMIEDRKENTILQE